MNEHLESRLRQHLSTLDSEPVTAPEAFAPAAAQIAGRHHRQRMLAVGAMCVALVAAAAGSLVALDRGRSEDSTSTPSTQQSTVPTTVVSTAPTVTTPTATTPTVTTPIEPHGPVPGSSREVAADPRGPTLDSAVVWTGTEIIAVGGRRPNPSEDLIEVVDGAAAYDPATDTWRTLTPPTTINGLHSVAAWTGSKALVIGGYPPYATSVAVYDLVTDTWAEGAATPDGALVSDLSTAVWTGRELLVWPYGTETGGVPAALAYDPSADTWRTLPGAPLSHELDPTSVWAGSEWIVWNGVASGATAGGAAYDPVTDSWRQIADAPIGARITHAVWTGSEMIVFGGRSAGLTPMAYADGAAYDPLTDTWRLLTPGPAHPGVESVLIDPRHLLTYAKGSVLGIYDIWFDRWDSTCCEMPNAVGEPLWTGSEIVVIGPSGTVADSERGGVTLAPPAVDPVATDCVGADVDVATEPAWRNPGNREWTLGDCLVRIDVIADEHAAEACGWQSVRVITTGDRLGARYARPGDGVTYVRDPRALVGPVDGFAVVTELPSGVTDTGYRSRGTELWMDAADPSSIYLVDRDRIERWSRAEMPACNTQ
jgi:hypothetical protein